MVSVKLCGKCATSQKFGIAKLREMCEKTDFKAIPTRLFFLGNASLKGAT